MNKQIDAAKFGDKFLRGLAKLFIGSWILMLTLGVLANNDFNVPALGFWTSFVIFYFVKVLANCLTNRTLDIYKD